MTRSEYRHATAIIWQGIGVLLLGASGSGKSSLAAEMITRGAEFIADDQVLLTLEDAKIYADAPPQLAGVIELRDVALLRIEHVGKGQMHMVVECHGAPEPHSLEILGLSLPRIALNPEHAGSAAKLILYAEAMQEGRVLPPDWKPSV